MNSVFVLAVVCVLVQTEARSLFAYQTRFSWCLAEKVNRIVRHSTWVPDCDFLGYDYESEQCDKDGNCWCVEESSGRPMYAYGFHQSGEVNCKKSQSCRENRIFRNCGSCTRKCWQRFAFCAPECRQGCFCPPNHFLLGVRCVPAGQCPPIAMPRTTSRTTTTPKRKETTTPEIPKETTSTVVTEIDIDNQTSASGFGYGFAGK